MNFAEFKDIRKFNRQNCDKICPDCGETLQPEYYGYTCQNCGLLLSEKLSQISLDEIFKA